MAGLGSQEWPGAAMAKVQAQLPLPVYPTPFGCVRGFPLCAEGGVIEQLEGAGQWTLKASSHRVAGNSTNSLTDEEIETQSGAINREDPISVKHF